MNFSLSCRNCNLCRNQRPSFYEPMKSDVMFVGISSQKNKDFELMPFDCTTNSGRVIREIETENKDLRFHKTNLVKCVSLKDGKIRYPSDREYENCFDNFERELKVVSPEIVFLFGSPVWRFIEKKYHVKLEKNIPFKINGINFVKVYHPSYVLVYRRKFLEEYKKNISNVIAGILKK